MNPIYLVHISCRVILPLFIGAMIYSLWGDAAVICVQWAMELPLIPTWRENLSGIDLPESIIYNLPDALWLFALLQFMDIIWSDDSQGHYWLALCVSLALVHEVGQRFGWFSGTYDDLDLLSYAIVTIISILLNRYLKS